MAILKIEIDDRYLNDFVNFIKLMPKDVIKVNIEESFEKELLKRAKEIKEKRVKLLNEEEVFSDVL